MANPGDIFENIFTQEILQPDQNVPPIMNNEKSIEEMWKIQEPRLCKNIIEMFTMKVTDEPSSRTISICAVLEMFNPMMYRATVDEEEVIIATGEEDNIKIKIPNCIGNYQLTKMTINNFTTFEHGVVVRGKFEMISYPIKNETFRGNIEVALEITYKKM